MIAKWTKLQSVLPDIASTIHNTKFSEADLLEWAFKAMDKIGSLEQYETKPAAISVSNYRACLPDDLQLIILMAYKLDTVESDEEELERIQREIQLDNDNYYAGFNGTDVFVSDYRPLRLSESPYAYTVHCTDCVNLYSISEHTYTIVPSKDIITSFKDGTICLIYAAHPVDSDGDYLIPDTADYIDAVRSYLLMRIHEYQMNMHTEGSADLYMHYAQRWDHMLKKVRGQAKMGSLDMLENLRQSRNRLVPKQRNYTTGFRQRPEEELNW